MSEITSMETAEMASERNNHSAFCDVRKVPPGAHRFALHVFVAAKCGVTAAEQFGVVAIAG